MRVFNELQKENLEYMTKLQESYKQLDEGKVVIKTMEQLKNLEDE